MKENDNDIYKYQPLWGNWYIDMPIGKGSFGSVYKIIREELGHTYTSAVKIISIPSEDQYREAEASFGHDEATLSGYFEDIVKNIVNEVNMLYSLSGNSNIVAYQDHKVVKKEDGIGWDVLIRMEYVTSLRKYLVDRQMTREEIVRLGIDICTALELCSKKGIIHRDIKDENIFINEDGIFKIGDFGIAKELSKSGRAASMRGTPLYMAPEVFRGDKYDAAVDIYSLGIVLYKLMNNGRMPFMPPYPQAIRFKDSEEALEKRMMGQNLPMPARSGESIGKIVLKACAYKAEDRYKKASEMKRELETALAGMPDEERDEKVTIAAAKKEVSEKSEIIKEAEISGKTNDDKTENDMTKSLFYNVTQAADIQENQNKTMSIFDSNSVTLGKEKTIPETQLYEETVGSGNETLSIFGSQKSVGDKDKEQDNEQDRDKNPEYQIPLGTTTSGCWNRTISEKTAEEEKCESKSIAEKPTKKRNNKLWKFGGIVAAAMAIILCLIFWNNSNKENLNDSSETASLSDVTTSDVEVTESPTWTDNTHEYVYFGSYPQTEVKGNELTLAIKNASYDNNGNATVAGVKYKQISSEDATYINPGGGDGFYYYNWSAGGNRYFRYEPIKWRVLSNDGTELFLLSEYCLTDQKYNETVTDVTWETCTMRFWLNDTFLTEAFTKIEQKAINETTVVNDNNPEYGTKGGNNTADKIFLLSIDESRSTTYGFSSDWDEYDAARAAYNTDFAWAKGAYSDYGNTIYRSAAVWGLRSSGDNGYSSARILGGSDIDRSGRSVDHYDIALRPALKINLTSVIE